MDNLFYTLLARIITLLQAEAGLSTFTIEQGRAKPVSEGDIPFIGVFLLTDTSIGEFGPQNTRFMDWDVTVAIEIMVDAGAAVANLDQTYLNIRTDVHAALMADVTLGETFVLMTVPIGASQPTLDLEGDRKTAVYTTSWLFRVRTSFADMTTV